MPSLPCSHLMACSQLYFAIQTIPLHSVLSDYHLWKNNHCSVLITIDVIWNWRFLSFPFFSSSFNNFGGFVKPASSPLYILNPSLVNQSAHWFPSTMLWPGTHHRLTLSQIHDSSSLFWILVISMLSRCHSIS